MTGVERHQGKIKRIMTRLRRSEQDRQCSLKSISAAEAGKKLIVELQDFLQNHLVKKYPTVPVRALKWSVQDHKIWHADDLLDAKALFDAAEEDIKDLKKDLADQQELLALAKSAAKKKKNTG